MIPFLLIFVSIAGASGLSMYERGTRLIADRYLRLDEVSVEEAFGEAAESAERAVPWLIVEHDGSTVRLRRGDVEVWSTVDLKSALGDVSLTALPDALERLELAIKALDVELPEDTDLPVVLMRGVCRALDRHSVILHKGRLDAFDRKIKGRLTGIGARVGKDDGEIVIRGVFPDGPGASGGMRAGDVVLRIDGVSTVGMTLRQSTSRLQGPARTQVEVQVRRRTDDGLDEIRELVLTRAEIAIPNVEWKMGDDGIGVVTIDHFSENTARLTEEALTEFDLGTSAGLPLRGLVLDLRGNSGGSMIQAAETADLFLNDGVIFRTTGRGGIPVPNLLREVRAHPAENAPYEPQVPIIVLQDRGSASASEILAGALTSLGRALVIGRVSHGKGTVQKVYFLRGGEDKVRLKLTVAEYRLAGDVPVHQLGIAPDIEVRRVRFHRYGAWVPRDADNVLHALVDVDERPGWRQGATVEVDKDPLMELARHLLSEITAADRAAGLDSLEQLVPILRDESSERVKDAFRMRNLDWNRSDEPQATLDVGVVVEVVGDARRGERAEVRAEVSNLGPAPLYQVRLRLTSDTRGVPWSGATIPIGFLPPGEKGIGSTLVALPIGGPSRSDMVRVAAEADGLDAVDLAPIELQIQGREAPAVSLEAKLVTHEDHHRIELELTNHGEEDLTGVRARFAWMEDSGLELLDRDGLLPVLGAGDSKRVDLALRILNREIEELPLELRVEAEQFQEVLRVPVTVPVSGQSVAVAAPAIALSTPVVSQVGDLRVSVVVTDDTAVQDVEVWWDGDKIAYSTGDDDQVKMDLLVSVREGVQRLSVVARDEDGVQSRRVRYVRGEPAEVRNVPAAMGTEADE